ncbi:MAG: glycosyltransferase, partial [bacterium]|nr:glycosyltransferase [bacterium]
DHGVDFDRFEQAGTSSRDPEDVAPIARPRIGFVGGIDSHTFDPALYVKVARSMPDAQFVLVGGCSLADGWCDLPNVHHLGRKPYDQVADYMASFDVLIMPWNQSDWIRACNPVKMKEYLAVGRPVVSTWFPEVERYRDHIAIAIGPDEFVACIRHAIESPGDPEPGRKRVESHTWQNKASEVWDRLQGTLQPDVSDADVGTAVGAGGVA